MRSKIAGTVAWAAMACGLFFFASGAEEYWESQSAQRAMASQWSNAPDARNARRVNAGPANAPQRAGRSSEESGHGPSAGHVPAPQRTAGNPAAGRERAIARLSIPRLHSTLYVVEGTSEQDLKRGPGHLTGSVQPGEKGNCVIAGHRDTHFGILRNVEDGDEIVLERNGRVYRYRVDGMEVVTPDNTASLMPARRPVLNLITCYPFRYLGSAPKRLIVHAALENTALASAR
ncbi:MAG: class D sortase [Acidobacteriota bacterium]|nr:class D sortase [Acidobacteriota bacterium]